MSVKNYRFVSPGVFVNEIDNSQLPASPAGEGPVIIGRAEKGPSMRPVTVASFSEFVNIFGSPVPGGMGGDVWREGNQVSPMYGTYAAQAYLRNSSPLTYIRLLGEQTPAATGAGLAGWNSATGITGAVGLFIFESGSSDGTMDTTKVTASAALAAIFYSTAEGTAAALSGSVYGPGAEASASSGLNTAIKNTGASYSFTGQVLNASGTTTYTTTFNFDRGSEYYIRKVFNTNPQLTNTDVTEPTQAVNYWLGETFDQHLSDNISAANCYAAMIPLVSGSDKGGDHLSPVIGGQTPPVIGQDLSSNSGSYVASGSQQLFKFITTNDHGDWTNRNLKISIQDIKVSTNESNPYGTFTVMIRHLNDSDNVVQVLEQYNDCDLNPLSLNYIGRKIGTQYRTWVAAERRYRTQGDWPNVSKYIRVELNSDLEAGSLDAKYLPFGWLGLVKYADVTGVSGSVRAANFVTSSGILPHYSASMPEAGTGHDFGLVKYKNYNATATASLNLIYPTPAMRLSASDGGLTNETDAYFGFRTTRSPGSTRFAESVADLQRPRGGIIGEFAPPTARCDRSVAFSLDDIGPISGSGDPNGTLSTTVWAQGLRATGSSWTARSGSTVGVLNAGYDRFTIPVYGGYDGLDITEMDPFRNSFINDSTNENLNYARATIKRAIDAVADPEVVSMNLASIPGLTDDGLTSHLYQTCEDRADALAVIDLPDGFTPRAEGRTVVRNNTAAALNNVITSLKARGINSSYACTFYPWLRARDSINGALLWVPPSVAAVGTFSSSQKKTQVWFAPAGFNRGGLTEGAAGIPIVDVSHQLRRIDRDNLYTANINPIAKFPSEGIVVFGQKTLQVTPSALDRINVRRMMIFVKKRISQIAANLLFDPNVQQTWLRFTSQVNPFLANVKTNFGLTDYKVILDDTTTTPDLVDRNIMYARIFLKPARAIEFIAIDFNITRTGASFDD